MPRVATVYVNSRSRLSPETRALLESNGIDYAEIDVTDAASMHDSIREKALSMELPVVELGGKFAAGQNIGLPAQFLGLRLPPQEPVFRGACC